jgi:mono/diheme cytochrome c family protein
MITFLKTVLVLAVLAIIGAVAFSFSGRYDVSAATPDSWPVAWLLRNTSAHSISKAAADIAIPPGLETPDAVKAGAQLYGQECVYCHGAPGEEATGLAKGLNPQPPALLAAERQNLPNVTFWVIKNGIRMTGMPAWGKTYADDKIWNVAAFLHQKRGLGAEEYKTLTAESGG